ncbi:hypothetical protein A3SI_06419 [Nitritalea halalkaliphila LW7]|uniref:DNA topoisomerase IV subunit B n=1 Tax=Nitritalea halalkaliphila LW7 TaxID=1189621 RepID=I5C6W7_9BACT|nr:hypothetical protein [Nitritalea halalkaliphila]EIM77569.1 hypothetical protein A3SI_06419 [Nitritalea halalkaliphila LW7]
MYFRFGKVFHFATVLLFIIIFLYLYASMPDRVAIEITAEGYPLKELAKDTFFYTGIFIFLGLNVALLFPAKLIENGSISSIRRIFPRGDVFRDQMLTWMYTFVGILNLSMGLLTLFVHSLNNLNEVTSTTFDSFFYIIPVVITLWIGGLFYLIAQKFKAIQA